jgi:hypothetical protein
MGITLAITRYQKPVNLDNGQDFSSLLVEPLREVKTMK